MWKVAQKETTCWGDAGAGGRQVTAPQEAWASWAATRKAYGRLAATSRRVFLARPANVHNLSRQVVASGAKRKQRGPLRTGIASRTFALMVFPSSSSIFEPGFICSWLPGMNPRMLGVSFSST